MWVISGQFYPSPAHPVALREDLGTQVPQLASVVRVVARQSKNVAVRHNITHWRESELFGRVGSF
jgi:hypothetical protein